MEKGRSHLLLWKALIKQEYQKKAKKARKEEKMIKSIPSLKEEIEKLKQMLVEKDRDIDRFVEDSQIFKQLYEDGFIDNDGNPIQR